MWKEELSTLLPLLGHRNWFLVTDKAFPLLSSPGITCFDTGGALPEVLDYILKEISGAPHLKPVIYTDKELAYLSEDICPGAEELYREIILKTKDGAKQIVHEDIFNKLSAASELFRVVVLKTEMLIPYSSVFIELDCGYWLPDQEKRLRENMRQEKAR